jgi:hypothetical protein
MSGNKNNPQDVNLFIEEQTALLLGAETMPLIGNTVGAVNAPEGMCFYYIQADGAANVVISNMKTVGATPIDVPIGTGDLTILAGGLLPVYAISQFTVSSGKYIAFLKKI